MRREASFRPRSNLLTRLLEGLKRRIRVWLGIPRPREEQLFFQARLLDSVGEALITTDASGIITYWNRAAEELYGWDREEAMGRSILEVTPALFGRERAAQVMGRLRAGESWSGEFSLRVPEGEEIEVDTVQTVPALSRDLTEHRRATDRLERLSRRLVDLQEEERRRLALELHDEFGQTVTALNMTLDVDEEGLAADQRTALAQARRLVDHLGEQIRRMTLDLRPTQLDDLGLVPALHAFFKRYEETTGVEVEFDHAGVRDRVPSPRTAAAAYRVIQESLTNVARHADVSRAEVRVWGEEDHLELRVRDGGFGFEASSVMGGGLTRGISGMKERVELLGGEFEVTSIPGKGTRIFARLPHRNDRCQPPRYA